jgi:nitrate reductase gamma subunit
VTQDIISIFLPGYIPPSTRRSLSGGAIAGVVLGSMIGLALLIALSIIVWRRRRARVPMREELSAGDKFPADERVAS